MEQIERPVRQSQSRDRSRKGSPGSTKSSVFRLEDFVFASVEMQKIAEKFACGTADIVNFAVGLGAVIMPCLIDSWRVYCNFFVGGSPFKRRNLKQQSMLDCQQWWWMGSLCSRVPAFCAPVPHADTTRLIELLCAELSTLTVPAESRSRTQHKISWAPEELNRATKAKVAMEDATVALTDPWVRVRSLSLTPATAAGAVKSVSKGLSALPSYPEEDEEEGEEEEQDDAFEDTTAKRHESSPEEDEDDEDVYGEPKGRRFGV